MYVCIQCHPSLSLLHWGNCLWEFVWELLDTHIFLCLSRYVSYVWETNDLLLRTLNHCLLHQSIRWWFDCFLWLDLSRSVLIHFPSIYLFFSWYLIHLAYIDLYSYQFTFYVRFFHTSFLYIPLVVRYYSFLLFHHWYIHLGFFLHHRYIHIGHPQIHGLWDSIHILHFIHRGMRFYHWDYWALFPFISSPYYLSLRYVMSLKDHPEAMTSHIVFDSSYVGDT